MVNPTESLERRALVTLGDELARAHSARTLSHALKVRLGLDRRGGLATLLRASEEREDDGPFTESGRFAAALVGRLRLDGRAELADALMSLLTNGPIDCDPMLWLNEIQAKVAQRSKAAAELRARGHPESARLIESTLSMELRIGLIGRLRAEGRHDLADAISAAADAFEDQERREGATPLPPRVPASEHAPPPELAALRALGGELGQTHAADVLAYALVTRLRDERREALAGTLMMFWARDVAGPIADPARLAADLIAQLHTEGRGELADTIASLLRGAAIDGDPCDVMAVWLQALAGPVVDPGPIAAALVAALRKQHHGALADAVEVLLNARG
jgi:hypothetical protein